jgi:hypothetical protein
MTTQLQRLRAIIMDDLRPDTEAALRVLGEAQNEPPLGEADGTISVHVYVAARDYVNAQRTADRLLAVLRSKLP